MLLLQFIPFILFALSHSAYRSVAAGENTGDGQFPFLSPLLIFLLLALLPLLMSCLKEDLWISWFPLHWLTLGSAALSNAAPLHGAENKHVVLALQQQLREPVVS